MNRLLALLVLLLGSAALAAPVVRVGSSEAGLADQVTVPGVTYVPAGPFAAAFGTVLNITAGHALLTFGPHVLELAISDDPALVQLPGGVRLDGAVVDGYAAIRTAAGVLLPVKTVATAFGAHVTVLSGREDAVEVRLPQARITGLESRQLRGGQEFAIGLNAPAAWSAYFNAPRNTLELRFGNTRTPDLVPPEAAPFRQVRTLTGSAGSTEVHLAFRESADYELVERRTAGGWELAVVLNARPDAPDPGPETAAVSAAGARIIVDPAGDQGLTDLALQIASELADSGMDVLTSYSPGTAAAAVVQLRLSGGAGRVLHLSDALTPEALADAVAEAGGDAEAVAGVRRRLLLDSSAADGGGERIARAVADSLNPGHTRLSGGPYPELLTGNGPAVRIEVTREDLSDPGLAARLAAALREGLGH